MCGPSQGRCIAEQEAPRGLVPQAGSIADLKHDAPLERGREHLGPQSEGQAMRQVQADDVNLEGATGLQSSTDNLDAHLPPDGLQACR